MFGIKKLLIGFCVGIVFGLWFGVNIGKDQAFYANPFHTESLKERMIESGGDMLEKGGQALKRSVGK